MPGLRQAQKRHSRGDEPTGVIVHIYMELSQGNSLGSYLYLKQAKMSFFFFLLYKIREQEDRTGPAWGLEGSGTNGRGWWRGKGVGG
jgi:hypothetical protein